MSQYVFSMNRVGKIVPPKRHILKDISLSFFPGAKIGVLGVNGSGKSTLLKIMAGIDKEIEGEAMPMAGLKIGYLPQEPKLEDEHTVRESVESGMGEVKAAQERLDQVYAAYAEPDADFDKLAAEQAESARAKSESARAKEAQNLETQRAARKCRADLSGKLVEMPSGRDRRRRARRCIDHGAPRRIPPRDHLCHFVVLAWHGAHHLVCDFAGLVRTPMWIDECGITPHRWSRTEHHAECNEVGAHDLDQVRSFCPWHAGGRGDQDLSGTRRSRAGAMRAKHLFPDLGRVVSHEPPSD
jgi:energy-coupling factor transporter ATP-binding protein EcfA2